MRFFVRKRRTTPTVIIVALIDILIVLLIFLLVTTTFKQQPALRLALPESTQAMKSGADEAAPVLVSVDEKGNLRLDNGSALTLNQLRSQLIAAVDKNPDRKLALAADKNAPFGRIVSVMDTAKEAKIKMVNAFMKEAGKP